MIRGRKLVLVSAISLSTAMLASCNKPPQVAPEQFKLLESLRTAVSAKKSDWLTSNAKAIDHAHDTGKINDEQYAEFQKIIADAKAGDWDNADREALRFEKAQH